MPFSTSFLDLILPFLSLTRSHLVKPYTVHVHSSSQTYRLYMLPSSISFFAFMAFMVVLFMAFMVFMAIMAAALQKLAHKWLIQFLEL